MDEAENSVKSEQKPVIPRNECLNTFDELLKVTGGFGRYQRFLFKFLSFGSILVGAQFGLQYFYGATPDFSCVSMPHNETCDPGKCCESCQKYEFHGPFTSAVSQWELICDRRHLKALIHTGYLTGMLVGSLLVSRISDNFGRKVAIFMSLGFQAMFTSASALSESLSLFIFLRFIAGVFTSGFLVPRFVYCVEIVSTANHSFFGIIIKLFSEPVGGCILAILAAWVTNWRHLMLVVSLPCFLPLIFWWHIPRSPRWLIANNHFDEAHDVLMKYARYNHVTVDSEHIKNVIHEVRGNETKSGILDIVKSTKLRKRTMILIFNWFVIALVYYGLEQSVNNLHGNMPVYVKNFFLFFNQAPCFAISFCLERFGRRLSYSSFMMLSGLIFMLALAVPSENEYEFLIVVSAIAGKFSIYISYMGLNFHAVELYPTVIRNTALGLSGLLIYIGGALAPAVASLGDVPSFGKTSPFLVFAILSLAAGITECWLPETSRSEMPQTVEEVEEGDEDYSFYCCKKRLNLPWRRLDDQRDVSQTKEQAEESWDEDHNFDCCTESLLHAWIRLDE